MRPLRGRTQNEMTYNKCSIPSGLENHDGRCIGIAVTNCDDRLCIAWGC